MCSYNAIVIHYDLIKIHIDGSTVIRIINIHFPAIMQSIIIVTILIIITTGNSSDTPSSAHQTMTIIILSLSISIKIKYPVLQTGSKILPAKTIAALGFC